MKNLAYLFLALLLISTVHGSYKRVCYFENWATYRPGDGHFTPHDIDPSLCTHIIYAFATLNPNSLIMEVFDPWMDIDKDGGFYKMVTDMKSAALKVMIGLGGWNDSAGNKYSQLVSDPAARANFVKEAIAFIKKYNFDGMDFDWEYPSCAQNDCGTGPASDKANFISMVKELKEAFEAEGLVLSAAVGAGATTDDHAYDIPELSKYLDFMNVMTYDFHGAWDSTTGYMAPFRGPTNTTEATIKYWIGKGADKTKLVVGLPTYGRSWTLASPSDNGLNATAIGGGTAGEATRQDGVLAYFEVCDRVKNQGWTVVQDPEGINGPYAYKGNQWVSYDDKDIIRKKCEFIKSEGLGGGMVWAIGMDDFRNKCGDGKYPLMNEVNSCLADAVVSGM